MRLSWFKCCHTPSHVYYYHTSLQMSCWSRKVIYRCSYPLPNIFTIFLLSIYIYTYYNINIYFWHRNWKSVSKTRIFNTLFLTIKKCNSFIFKSRYNSILLLGQFSTVIRLSTRFSNSLLIYIYAYIFYTKSTNTSCLQLVYL